MSKGVSKDIQSVLDDKERVQIVQNVGKSGLLCLYVVMNILCNYILTFRRRDAIIEDRKNIMNGG